MLLKRNLLKFIESQEVVISVEMGGLEPPSKHRTRQLSTCLSVPLVVGNGLPEGGLTEAYLLKLDEG